MFVYVALQIGTYSGNKAGAKYKIYALKHITLKEQRKKKEKTSQ